VWVGNRICEVLPVSLRAKQKLMELDDARARLDIVLRFLQQHAVIQ
jgi:Lon protease-like protein